MSQYITQVHDLILHKMELDELTFESKEALKSVLQEYEIHIKYIEQQLEECKKDHVDLQSEIVVLVEENKVLIQKLKMASENAILKAEQPRPSEELDNIKHQLDLALEEKKSLESLWKSSLTELENVKEKLKDHQSGKQLTDARNRLNDAQRDYSEAIKILESQLSTLKNENDRLVVKNNLMEEHLEKATDKMAQITEKSISMSNLLKDATDQEHEWKSKYLSLEAKYIELDKSYQADKVKFAPTYEYERRESNLESKLTTALQQRDELQVALERCYDKIAELKENAASDRKKIEEAVVLVEEALQGRNEALAQQATSIEELNRLKTELNNFVEEAGLKVGEEVAAVRNHFQRQEEALRKELQQVKQECDRKTQEVQQLEQECERLQDLKDKLTEPVDELPERRHLAKAYKELKSTEAECQQLYLENKELNYSLSQLQERCRKNSQAKIKLKNELKNVQQQYQGCQHELAVTMERADLVGRQLHQTNLELTQLQNEAILHRDSVASVQSNISVANTIELYKRLDDSYGQMNDRWKNEMNALTEKFEAKIKKLKRKNKSRSEAELNGEGN